MNQSMQRAIQHLFQVSSLEAVSREQLQTFVDEYPCFGFGHYLLSRKLQVESSDQFLSATQKTSLYFSNPFWLSWMLENAADSAVKEMPHRESSISRFESSSSQAEATAAHPESPIQDKEPALIVGETLWPGMESPATPAETSALHSDPDSPNTAAELLHESIEKAKALRESLEKINEDYHFHNVPETSQPPIHTEAPIQDEEPPFILDETDRPLEIGHASKPEPATPIEHTPTPEASFPIEHTPTPETSSPIEHTPTPEPAPQIEHTIPEATPAPESTAPLFEPLHTIDYFASQGIRLTLDDNPTDALGRQLKSFTEWLRTMRRLPQKDREIIPDRVAEQTVQNFAAHSIEGKEPVTETMAEVLAKQGMPERARIVYEKLSLLNPDKSAYFAAKIEQLNIP